MPILTHNVFARLVVSLIPGARISVSIGHKDLSHKKKMIQTNGGGKGCQSMVSTRHAII